MAVHLDKLGLSIKTRRDPIANTVRPIVAVPFDKLGRKTNYLPVGLSITRHTSIQSPNLVRPIVAVPFDKLG
jgi:hypothetical protein